MAIVTSRWAQAVDAIVAMLRASPVFADPVSVFDGWHPFQDWSPDTVFVGFDGDELGNWEAATTSQEWYVLGNTSRLEELNIRGAVLSWSGDIEPKANRDRATALLAGVETVFRVDPTLGIDGSTIATLAVGSFFQEMGPGGGQCRITFEIQVRTYLPST